LTFYLVLLTAAKPPNRSFTFEILTSTLCALKTLAFNFLPYIFSWIFYVILLSGLSNTPKKRQQRSISLILL